MQKKNTAKKEVAEAAKIAREVFVHYLGERSSRKADQKTLRIEPLAGGLTNFVFSVHASGGDFIVRLGENAEKITSFLKEQWAIAKAREAGVPAPEVLELGNDAAPVAYMILRQAHGMGAVLHPERMKIIRHMGRYARVIHSIRTTGFGSTFEWSRNRLSHNKTWSEFLRHELKMDERLETLGNSGMLPPAVIKKLRAALEGAAGKQRAPRLNHGDLRLKNVLANEKGAISCILDWEHCISNLAPEWDVAIALHDLSIDEKQEFLDGYGLTGKRFAAIAPLVKALTVINYAPLVESASRSKNKNQLERYRTRLRGDLDLYSL